MNDSKKEKKRKTFNRFHSSSFTEGSEVKVSYGTTVCLWRQQECTASLEDTSMEMLIDSRELTWIIWLDGILPAGEANLLLTKANILTCEARGTLLIFQHFGKFIYLPFQTGKSISISHVCIQYREMWLAKPG